MSKKDEKRKEQGKKLENRRITKFDRKVADKILMKLRAGVSLNKICQNPPMPTREQFYSVWLKDEDFLAEYMLAKEIGVESVIDDILAIADDTSVDTIKFKTKDGRDAEKANYIGLKRSELKIEARKWYASKIAPKKYGNNLKVEAENKNSGELKIILVNDYEADNGN